MLLSLSCFSCDSCLNTDGPNGCQFISYAYIRCGVVTVSQVWLVEMILFTCVGLSLFFCNVSAVMCALIEEVVLQEYAPSGRT